MRLGGLAALGVALSLLPGLPTGAGEDDAMEATIDGYGRYAGSLGPHIDDAGRSFRGVAKRRERLLEQTDQIPCRIGERFGAYFRVSAFPESRAAHPFTIVWQHPRIQDLENGISGKETRYPSGFWRDGKDAVTFGGWAFDDEDDLVGGHWRVSVRHADRELAARSFRVVGCTDSGE